MVSDGYKFACMVDDSVGCNQFIVTHAVRQSFGFMRDVDSLSAIDDDYIAFCEALGPHILVVVWIVLVEVLCKVKHGSHVVSDCVG